MGLTSVHTAQTVKVMQKPPSSIPIVLVGNALNSLIRAKACLIGSTAIQRPHLVHSLIAIPHLPNLLMVAQWQSTHSWVFLNGCMAGVDTSAQFGFHFLFSFWS